MSFTPADCADRAVPARLLRVSDVASRLSISKRSVWGMISAGQLPAIRFGRRATRIDSRDLETLVEELRARGAEIANAPTTKLPYRSVSGPGTRVG